MRRALSAAVALTTLAFSGVASANATGIGGFSGKTGGTCGTCHNGGTAPTVAIDGPKTLAAGQSGDYTFTVATTAAKASGGIAASDGTKLTPGTGLRDQAGELVQSASIAPTGGKATFTFKVTAPTAGDKLTLFAAGLGSDGTATTGDAHAATKLEVAVTGGAPAPASTTPAKDDAKDDPKPKKTTKSGDDDDDTPSETANRDPFASDPTGCSMTRADAGTSAGALLVALGVLAAARRRLRRRGGAERAAPR